MITAFTLFWSPSISLNYCKYVILSFFYFICLVSSLKSSGLVHNCSFLKKLSLKSQLSNTYTSVSYADANWSEAADSCFQRLGYFWLALLLHQFGVAASTALLYSCNYLILNMTIILQYYYVNYLKINWIISVATFFLFFLFGLLLQRYFALVYFYSMDLICQYRICQF